MRPLYNGAEMRLALFPNIVEQVAWRDNALLYEVRLQLRETGWLCVLKAARGEEYRVGFVGAKTFAKLIERVWEELDGQTFRWREDDFPPAVPPVQLRLDL